MIEPLSSSARREVESSKNMASSGANGRTQRAGTETALGKFLQKKVWSQGLLFSEILLRFKMLQGFFSPLVFT